MAKINLLPWREELRSQRQAEFFTAMGVAAAVTVLLFGIFWSYMGQKIEYQSSRNQYLQDQIALLDTKITEIQELEKEKARLLARMRAIETLQTSRPIIVRLFDELISTLPDGVFITDISQTGSSVTVKGVAQSNARVSNFMRAVEASEWLTAPSLDVIETKTQDNRRLSNFTLKVNQVLPKPVDPDEVTEDAA